MTLTTQFFCGMIFMLCILVIFDEVIADYVDFVFISIVNIFINGLNVVLFPVFWIEYQILMYIEKQRIKREIELQIETLLTEHLNQDDETQS